MTASRVVGRVTGWLTCVTCAAAMFFVLSAPQADARTEAQARAACPDGNVCLFEDINWNGRWLAFRSGISDFRTFGFNDRASSVYNESGFAYCLFEHVDFAWPNALGRSYKVISGRRGNPNLHAWINYGDVASSGYRTPYESSPCNGQQVN
jgi:hypothetical protein